MKTIDLEKIMTDHNIDQKVMAKELFPSNKFPKVALDRILSKQAVLDANQISKLATFIGVEISHLFENDKWKSTLKKGIHTLTNGDYRAELNTETWVTKVYCKKSLLHETVIHAGTTTLSNYINELNKIIIKFSKNEASKN